MHFFLDIDGVLTSSRGHVRGGSMDRDSGCSNVIDPLSVAIVNILARHTGAEIVIISNRRNRMRSKEIEKWLRDGGLEAPFAEAGWCIERDDRSQGIDEYCRRNKLAPEDMFILDDSGSDSPRQVMPDAMNGLIIEDFLNAAKKLNMPEDAVNDALKILEPLQAASKPPIPRRMSDAEYARREAEALAARRAENDAAERPWAEEEKERAQNRGENKRGG